MPTFRLGSRKVRLLDGSDVMETVTIIRKTEKAVLIQINRGGAIEEHWLPRSQIDVRQRAVIRMRDGKVPQDTGEKRLEVHVPDWLWEIKKREPARPMGCY